MIRLRSSILILMATATLAVFSNRGAANDAEPQWLTKLSEGVRRAQRGQRPIFVRVTGESCQWCAKLETALGDAKLKSELARWTLVKLDAEKSDNAELKSLDVGGLPSLRILSPLGRRIAAFDGYKPADELREWLQKHHDAAASVPSDEQLSEGEPSAEVVTKLVAALSERDPLRREAAIRRLAPYPAVSAGAVVEILASGSLQARLAAIELMQEWQAAIDGLDPWRPDTFSPEKLQSVRSWAPGVKPAEPATETKPLSAEQLTAARRELDRLADSTDAEAAAIRERLARHRAALMPEVLERLKDPPSDMIRERLTALRYRLVARDALALSWPGGLERLASPDAARRHESVGELMEIATPADEALLLELFASPDAFVRELSLRTLNARAGRATSGALVKLLRDPEPNVRAAVLKQLAEKPSPNIVKPLAEFVATEPDADLVVHAVRALKALPTPDTLTTLVSLIQHASWRVRAEAVEAVGKRFSEHGEQDADAEAALIRALADSDGFVAARAVTALAHSHAPAKNAALIKLAETAPPTLAAEAVAGISIAGDSDPKLIESMQKFQKHAQPVVRASAVKHLSAASPKIASAALQVGLKDSDSLVRIAAAESVRTILDAAFMAAMAADSRNYDGYLAPSTLRDPSKNPAWLAPVADWLRPLLSAETPEERLAAARSLIALGKEDDVIPVILAVSKIRHDLLDESGDVLTWLPWAKRLEVYRQLNELGPTEAQRVVLVTGLSHDGDKQAIPLLWEAAAGDKVHSGLANSLITALGVAYSGPQWRLRRQALEGTVRSKVIEALAAKVASGSELQRLVALAVLAGIDSNEAASHSARLVDDTALAKPLRLDAFHVRLASLPEADRNRVAVAALAHEEPGIRSTSAQYLAANDFQMLMMLRNRTIWLNVASPTVTVRPTEAQPFEPKAAPGLEAEPLRKLLTDPDDHTAGAAGYLLTLLGDASGLDVIVRLWRQSGGKVEFWPRLVTRAVTVLSDDANVRYLDEIYRLLPVKYFDVPEFYWTIRNLEGPNALRLRKQIRKDVGMERLRNENSPPPIPH